MVRLIGECVLFGGIGTCCGKEVDHDIRIIGKNVSTIYISTNIEGAGYKCFLIGRCTEAKMVPGDVGQVRYRTFLRCS